MKKKKMMFVAKGRRNFTIDSRCFSGILALWKKVTHKILSAG